jgi:hypothetical protein
LIVPPVTAACDELLAAAGAELEDEPELEDEDELELEPHAATPSDATTDTTTAPMRLILTSSP